MNKNKWMLLQLFADGGEGGSGSDGGAAAASPVESSVDDGHKRLLELGVPADKLRKNRAYKVNAPAPKPAEAGQDAAQAQEPEQVAAAEPTEGAPQNEPATPRMTWEEVKADPEFSRKMQEMVQARLRKVSPFKEQMDVLTPALEHLALRYDMDPLEIDYAQLAKKITEDKPYYDQKGLEMGTSTENARDLTEFRLMKMREAKRRSDNARDMAMQQHHSRLQEQAQAFRQSIPDFDLDKELQNPAFMRLTAPGVNVSVEDAYYLIHRKEIQEAQKRATAQTTAQQISNAIRSGNSRPDENGGNATAPSVSNFDYSKASKQERAALKQAIRDAAARGEKLYPGKMPFAR